MPRFVAILLVCLSLAVLGIGYAFDPTPVIDALAFWAAGHLALLGEAVAAYDPQRIRAVEEAALGHGFDLPLPWLNPPIFLLVWAPLALLPYALAWPAWVVGSGMVFGVGIRAARGSLLWAFAAPATLLSAMIGQNGLLSAGLLGMAMALRDRRPWLAGACLGALVYKPHLGLLFPLLLLATGRWRVILGAAASGLALGFASVLAFGLAPWRSFLASAGAARWALEVTLAKQQSVYAFGLRVLDAPGLAGLVHAIVAAAAAGAALWAWRRQGGAAADQAAAALAAVLLVTPYTYAYDAPILVMAAAFLAGQRSTRGEVALIGVSAVLPAVGAFGQIGLTVPLAAAILLGIALRRTASAAARQPSGS